jgi:hypothetical protein
MKKEKAWDILTSDEQTAITLSLSHGKSSWEVGEIMGRAHYKYLEISSRAKRFFRLFTEYFAEHHRLFPEGVRVDPLFQDYMEKAIMDKLPLKSILQYLADKNYNLYKKRKKHITEQMALLRSQTKGKDVHDMILEFDRWNNYRILPTDLQEPSAFKRREKTREKNRLKLVSDLPKISIDIIVQRYKYEGKLVKLWLPLVDQRLARGFFLTPVKKHTTTISGITYLGIPLFEDEETAEEYISLVYDFMKNQTKSCLKGLNFWPQYRVLFGKALNYDKLENIKVNRKYYEKIFDDDHIKARKLKIKRDKQLTGVKPANPNDLWGKIG